MPKGRKPLEGSFKNVAMQKVLEVLRNAEKPLRAKEITEVVLSSGENYPDAPASLNLHVYNALKDLGDKVKFENDPTSTRRPAKLYSLA